MDRQHKTTVEALHTILADEAKGYRHLVRLSQRENTALKEENLKVLAVTVQDKESLLIRLKQWELTREQTVARLVRQLDLPANVTLTELLIRLDKTVSTKLAALRNEIAALAEQLVNINHSNQLMLQSGLVRVNATFDYLISTSVPVENSYSVPGDAARHYQVITGNVLNREV